MENERKMKTKIKERFVKLSERKIRIEWIMIFFSTTFWMLFLIGDFILYPQSEMKIGVDYFLLWKGSYITPLLGLWAFIIVLVIIREILIQKYQKKHDYAICPQCKQKTKRYKKTTLCNDCAITYLYKLFSERDLDIELEQNSDSPYDGVTLRLNSVGAMELAYYSLNDPEEGEEKES